MFCCLQASWAAAHEEDKRKQSAFQAGAAEALASLGLRAEEEHWEGDYSVDLAVCLPLPSLLQQLQGQGQGPAQSQKGQASGGYTGGVPWVKIAVEVDGPSHFARSLCHCAQGPLQGGSAAAHGAASGSGKSQGLAEGADRGGAGCQAGKTEGALGTARDGGGRVVADSGPEGEGLWALGPTRLKTQLLKAMGWVVVQVRALQSLQVLLVTLPVTWPVLLVQVRALQSLPVTQDPRSYHAKQRALCVVRLVMAEGSNSLRGPFFPAGTTRADIPLFSRCVIPPLGFRVLSVGFKRLCGPVFPAGALRSMGQAGPGRGERGVHAPAHPGRNGDGGCCSGGGAQGAPRGDQGRGCAAWGGGCTH